MDAYYEFYAYMNYSFAKNDNDHFTIIHKIYEFFFTFICNILIKYMENIIYAK